MLKDLVFFLEVGVKSVQGKVDLLIVIGFFLPVLVVICAIVIVTLLFAGLFHGFFVGLLPLRLQIMNHILMGLQVGGDAVGHRSRNHRCIYHVT